MGNTSNNQTPAGTTGDTRSEVTQAAQAATTGQPAGQHEQVDPAWLDGRLSRHEEQVKAKLYADLGASEADIKALLNADKERKDAEKGFEQRYKDRDQAYKTLEANHKTMREAFNTYLNTEIEAIPKEHQERAKKLLDKVGDDPVLRLEVLNELKPLFTQPSQQQPEKRKPEEIDARSGGTAGGAGTPQYTDQQKKDIAAKYGQTYRGG